MCTYRVVSVSSDKSHGVGQDSTRDGVSWRNTDTRSHGRLRLLRDNTRVKLDEVRMLIQIPEFIGNLRIRVNFLERLVGLQTKELAELVQGANVPPTSLVDTQNLNGLKSLRDVPGAERTYKC